LKKERSATQAKLDALNTRSKADIDKRVAAAMDRIFGTDKPKQPTASRAIERSTAKLAELQSRVAEKQKAAIAARERTNKLRSDFVAKYGYDPIVGRKK
jgi:predicted  nucleic acid-binding Zn-ribbon protein